MHRADAQSRGATTLRAPPHAFWAVACLTGFLLVLWGFSPSYYFRPWFRATSLPWLLQLHGALMTSWFVLFLVPVGLIAKHRVAVHRRFGVAGATLAGIIVVVGTITALRFLRNNLDTPPAFGPPAPEFFGFLLFDLYVFGGLVAFDQLSPKLAFLGSGGPGGLFALDLLLLYTCIAYDTWRTRRIHPALLIGGVFICFGDSTLLGRLVQRARRPALRR